MYSFEFLLADCFDSSLLCVFCKYAEHCHLGPCGEFASSDKMLLHVENKLTFYLISTTPAWVTQKLTCARDIRMLA